MENRIVMSPQSQVADSAELPPSSDSPQDDSGCPPPLHWRDVLAHVAREAEESIVERPDGPIRVSSFGTGPPLYLLGGFASTRDLFALLMYLLRDEFRCVVIDDSSAIANRRVSGDSMSVLVDDLWTVAESQQDESFSVFATSFGATVSLAATIDRPKKIVKAVLQGGFANRRWSRTERFLSMVGRNIRRAWGQTPFVDTILERNHRRWFPPFDPDRWEFAKSEWGRVPTRVVLWRARCAGRVDLRPRLPFVTTPVLLVRTEGDGPASVAEQDILESALPEAHSETLIECGPAPYATHPHKLAQCLRSFLPGPDARDSVADSLPE